MPAAIQWTTQKPAPNAVRVNVPYRQSSDWRWRVLLTSDRHWDNPHSDQGLQLQHLQEAQRTGAGIIDNGDLFCAMQGKYDPRSSKSAVREEHQVDSYLDALVSTGGDFFGPFARNFITLGTGNHEFSIRNRYETDLTERLAERLRDRGGTVEKLGNRGWVQFCFYRRSGRTGKKLGCYQVTLFMTHGTAGASAPVTKGVIHSSRRAAYIEGADIVLSGHIHESWMMELQRTGISSAGIPYRRSVYHLCCPTYKDEFGEGSGGWHNEREAPPKPIGAWWLEFGYRRRDGQITVEPRMAR